MPCKRYRIPATSSVSPSTTCSVSAADAREQDSKNAFSGKRTSIQNLRFLQSFNSFWACCDSALASAGNVVSELLGATATYLCISAYPIDRKFVLGLYGAP